MYKHRCGLWSLLLWVIIDVHASFRGRASCTPERGCGDLGHQQDSFNSPHMAKEKTGWNQNAVQSKWQLPPRHVDNGISSGLKLFERRRSGWLIPDTRHDLRWKQGQWLSWATLGICPSLSWTGRVVRDKSWALFSLKLLLSHWSPWGRARWQSEDPELWK